MHHLEYHSESDVLLVSLGNVAESFGEWVHGLGLLSTDRDGNLVEVEILNASEGVNFDAPPRDVREAVRKFLKDTILVSESSYGRAGIRNIQVGRKAGYMSSGACRL